MRAENDHLAMLRSPERWPRWPVLPVVRGPVDAGVVIHGGAEAAPTVYIVNLYSLKPGLLVPQLKDRPKHVYATLEAMLADGWRVD